MADASEWASMMRKPHKYGVAPKEQRTYSGVVYDSKAEGARAAELDLLVRVGDVPRYERQCEIALGPDFGTVVDFIVWTRGGRHVEEVKGKETPRFRQVRRLWKKYGPMPMHILKRRGKGWKVEILEGRKD